MGTGLLGAQTRPQVSYGYGGPPLLLFLERLQISQENPFLPGLFGGFAKQKLVSPPLFAYAALQLSPVLLHPSLRSFPTWPSHPHHHRLQLFILSIPLKG